eukprot:1147595-Pelagomonas_calceolata.AAC.2
MLTSAGAKGSRAVPMPPPKQTSVFTPCLSPLSNLAGNERSWVMDAWVMHHVQAHMTKAIQPPNAWPVNTGYVHAAPPWIRQAQHCSTSTSVHMMIPGWALLTCSRRTRVNPLAPADACWSSDTAAYLRRNEQGV